MHSHLDKRDNDQIYYKLQWVSEYAYNFDAASADTNESISSYFQDKSYQGGCH